MKSIVPVPKTKRTIDASIADGNRIGSMLKLSGVVWSVSEITSDMIHDVAFKNVIGGIQLRYELNWGNPVSEILPSTCTWADFARAAHRLIKQSGDRTHIFIEDFKADENNVVFLITGS